MTVRAHPRRDLALILRTAWPEAENHHHAVIQAEAPRVAAHPLQVITAGGGSSCRRDRRGRGRATVLRRPGGTLAPGSHNSFVLPLTNSYCWRTQVPSRRSPSSRPPGWTGYRRSLDSRIGRAAGPVRGVRSRSRLRDGVQPTAAAAISACLAVSSASQRVSVCHSGIPAQQQKNTAISGTVSQNQLIMLPSSVAMAATDETSMPARPSAAIKASLRSPRQLHGVCTRASTQRPRAPSATRRGPVTDQGACQ